MDPAEVNRRIVAARILLGMSQNEMSAAGHEKGLGKHDLARVERGQKGLQDVYLRTLAEVLDVPISWFTAPREQIVAHTPTDLRDLLNEVVRRLVGVEAIPEGTTDEDVERHLAELGHEPSDGEPARRVDGQTRTRRRAR